MNTFQWIKKEKLIAIIRGYNTADALAIAKALYEGGITTLEVTLNSESPLQTIEKIRNELGNEVKVGAGTVLDSESARLALSAGAQFILSPSLDIDSIKLTKRYGAVSIPGAFTPTEIVTAFQEGADIIKVFPASSLGPNYIKDLQGPLPQLKLLPTGGITLENVASFIQKGAIGVGLGSALIPNTCEVTADYLSTVTKKASAFTGEITK
ncbi:bifunctional 4-hydroxy-2-oxoglutarate aldolase/2-dehydro-3-deoxy-phosphogluconate aldolase [Virgibacillus salexigens]|uniref:2-dehydro-3-deoxy-6-phosphogalactonate aldolase n=1 Tax=Virgibacillus massiliensis TaxID=1462526 RepID=A0A024QHH3_9BACI|nr:MULTISPECIES: bifunctional 4-hydroxy-2-oxoglutarate aldolase/2-dehydro-3-deoxy-phosphogluconate aldolase [Virgibacillus]MYL43206.1 bifunctional 4-hydroxy-2-oxoglutarate aldolase/2-dehydro-3-deoxy-phosphogluconate aldolase [Virgibacillus massiliensis]CDQ41660.1 2-dehydro-3-deoxy-6-phosphogalactonate aldolase [Virgibacillus massiliensis]